MQLERLNDYRKIFLSKDIYDLFSETLFSPSHGRVKSIAEGIYKKQQGLFYTCHDESNNLIGIIGVTLVRQGYARINQIAVAKSHRLNGIAKEMIEEIAVELSLKSMEVSVNFGQSKIFQKLYFKFIDSEDDGTDIYVMKRKF